MWPKGVVLRNNITLFEVNGLLRCEVMITLIIKLAGFICSWDVNWWCTITGLLFVYFFHFHQILVNWLLFIIIIIMVTM